MILNGKEQLTMIFEATPDKEAEGDRVLKSHAAWMKETHYREGEKALLQYMVAKGSDDDGNIHFVVTEVYETGAGLKDHGEQAGKNWKDFEDWKKWTSECESTSKVATVIDSLW
jgi:hypothetical protein